MFPNILLTKQKPSESVQLFAERLLNNAEDAYPQAGDRPVVEQQMINVLLDGLYHDYLKMKVLREDPRTFNEALQIAMREQNIRKHLLISANRVVRFSFRTNQLGSSPASSFTFKYLRIKSPTGPVHA
jgi:hypothetical protein